MGGGGYWCPGKASAVREESRYASRFREHGRLRGPPRWLWPLLVVSVAVVSVAVLSLLVWRSGGALRTAAVGRTVVALGDPVPSGHGCDCRACPETYAATSARRVGVVRSTVNLAVDGYTSAEVRSQVVGPAARATLQTANTVVIMRRQRLPPAARRRPRRAVLPSGLLHPLREEPNRERGRDDPADPRDPPRPRLGHRRGVLERRRGRPYSNIQVRLESSVAPPPCQASTHTPCPRARAMISDASFRRRSAHRCYRICRESCVP